ncbi:hypothetical protein B7463_g9123, partial [Scytalidium lignicola]
MPFRERIDTLAHFLPPFYRQACEETGHGRPDGMPAIPSEESHLEVMKEVSITKSILSISSPGVYLHGDANSARKLARQCNEFAADIVKRRPQEFGFWASILLPDIVGSLEELSYAPNTLKAEGIALETNYEGIYLRDITFDPIFEKLNESKVTVFIYPTSLCIK